MRARRGRRPALAGALAATPGWRRRRRCPEQRRRPEQRGQLEQPGSSQRLEPGRGPRCRVDTAVELVHGVPSGPSIPITMQPVGLSLEYPVMAQDLGTGPCPPPALATELEKLGSPPISLAGDSQDLTAPSGALSAPYSSWETAVLYSLPANFWSQLQCLLSAAKDPLTVGINLKTGQLAWATQIAAGAQSAATNGLAFSLGNEPDLYDLPNYSALGKPQSAAAAASLYLQLATYLRPAIGSAPLVGPELASAEHWRSQLPQIIAALHIQTVGVHAYPLSVCGSPHAATVSGLLSPRVADTPSALAWVVADANAAGVPAILSEANSVSCGGKTGVSDSPASAVWAVRFVLSALKTGLREVRFHFAGGAYDPFIVRGQEVIDRPLDSAMVALNQWLPVGSSLQSLTGREGPRRDRRERPGRARSADPRQRACTSTAGGASQREQHSRRCLQRHARGARDADAAAAKGTRQAHHGRQQHRGRAVGLTATL